MPTSRSGRGKSFAQLLERDARRVAGEDRVRLHLRLDAGKDFALELEIFRHRLDDQVGAGDAVALEIGNEAIERVAHAPAVVAADLSIKLRGALDRAADRILVGIAERDDKAVPRAPRGDVAAHGAGADDMHAASVPVAAGEVFQIFAQEKHAHEILRSVADEKLGEGRNLRLLHRLRRRRRARPTDRSRRRARDNARAAPAWRPRSPCARPAGGAPASVEERTGEALLGLFQFRR